MAGKPRSSGATGATRTLNIIYLGVERAVACWFRPSKYRLAGDLQASLKSFEMRMGRASEAVIRRNESNF
jgi:hypothetical protein